jgi:hypothetical protein
MNSYVASVEVKTGEFSEKKLNIYDIDGAQLIASILFSENKPTLMNILTPLNNAIQNNTNYHFGNDRFDNHIISADTGHMTISVKNGLFSYKSCLADDTKTLIDFIIYMEMKLNLVINDSLKVAFNEIVNK